MSFTCKAQGWSRICDLNWSTTLSKATFQSCVAWGCKADKRATTRGQTFQKLEIELRNLIPGSGLIFSSCPLKPPASVSSLVSNVTSSLTAGSFGQTAAVRFLFKASEASSCMCQSIIYTPKHERADAEKCEIMTWIQDDSHDLCLGIAAEAVNCCNSSSESLKPN